MKNIAWGTSKLLWLQQAFGKPIEWAYVVDDFSDASDFFGIPVKRSTALSEESDFKLTIFAVSNSSISEILQRLAVMGLSLGQQVQLYSDLFATSFASDLQEKLGWHPEPRLQRYATSFTLNSRAPVHTTICGTWLVLESLRRSVPGDIAEVGAFEGGNALAVLQSPDWAAHSSRYMIFDSLEGFPELTDDDPKTFTAGDYATGRTAIEIVQQFSMFPEATFTKGFVPSTFSAIAPDQTFSVVFYDCDLYQPALDTYEFFWSRLSDGGIILVHDYFAQPGGFEGVKKATDMFCDRVGAKLTPLWQSTMAVIQKV